MHSNPLTLPLAFGAFFLLEGIAFEIARLFDSVRHGSAICPAELRNATQFFCGGLRA